MLMELNSHEMKVRPPGSPIFLYAIPAAWLILAVLFIWYASSVDTGGHFSEKTIAAVVSFFAMPMFGLAGMAHLFISRKRWRRSRHFVAATVINAILVLGWFGVFIFTSIPR
jgi:hypothetical protein